MPRDTEFDSLSLERFVGFLRSLDQQGYSQAEIAAKVRIPAQYLSDLKHGRRPMTERIARRFGEAFHMNYQWLLAVSDEFEVRSDFAGNAGGGVWLPLFQHPIEGEPRTHPQWDGVGVQLAGVAASRVTLATNPYVLRFGRDDVEGRLQKGDLVLMSQDINPKAEIHVIRHRRRLFLARAGADGARIRVAGGKALESPVPIVGHCLGVIWSRLCDF
jgi:hypothetical protein